MAFFVRGIVCGILLSGAAFPVAPVRAQREDAAATAARVAAIRREYSRIQAAEKRYTRKERDLPGFSVEGGTLTGYFLGKAPQKVVATYYGESGRTINEFYFGGGGALVFLLSTRIQYASPLSSDAKNAGDVAFTKQERFYFHRGNLIRWLDGAGKPSGADAGAALKKAREVKAEAADLLARLRRPRP